MSATAQRVVTPQSYGIYRYVQAIPYWTTGIGALPGRRGIRKKMHYGHSHTGSVPLLLPSSKKTRRSI